MNIIDLMNRHFIKSSAINGNRSQREESGHIASLTKCLTELGITSLSDLSEDTGYAMISWYRKNTDNSSNSIRKRISYLKKVLKRYKVKTTFYDTELPRQDTKPYVRLHENELKIIFRTLSDMMDSKFKTANTVLYKLLIYMLLDTGLRIGELLSIQIKNIDLENDIIVLDYTKSGNRETIPFSSFSKPLIQEVINLNYDEQHLFFNVLKDRPMDYYHDVRNFMRRLKEKTGINIHAHRFRKAYGTMIYNETNDIRLVQKLLRHSKSSTTEIYISEGMDNVFKKYHEVSDIFKKVKE